MAFTEKFVRKQLEKIFPKIEKYSHEQLRSAQDLTGALMRRLAGRSLEIEKKSFGAFDAGEYLNIVGIGLFIRDNLCTDDCTIFINTEHNHKSGVFTGYGDAKNISATFFLICLIDRGRKIFVCEVDFLKVLTVRKNYKESLVCRRILRCETAPLCALSAVMYDSGEF